MTRKECAERIAQWGEYQIIEEGRGPWGWMPGRNGSSLMHFVRAKTEAPVQDQDTTISGVGFTPSEAYESLCEASARAAAWIERASDTPKPASTRTYPASDVQTLRRWLDDVTNHDDH